jgi:hypothetical protein
MSADAIQGTFDDLVIYWEMSEDARYAIDEFQGTNAEPQPPENPIQSVGELINYNRQRWSHEQTLENLRADHARTQASFENTANRVRHLLPEGLSLRHTVKGTVYTISHILRDRDQPGEIRVEKRGHPPR